MTVIGLAVPDFDPATPPFDDVHVAVRLLIAAPLAAGLTNVTRSCPDATFATVGFAGWAGAPTVIAPEATDFGLVPRAFVAVTVQVYSFAVVAPVTVIGPAVDALRTALVVTPLLLEVHVAVNFVMAAPLLAPAV
jgi:hypothetical protein